MLKAIITCKGQTLSDLMLAIEEATKRIETGCVTGSDSNDTGNFDFIVSGNDESEK